jgi:hypothetical protein
MKTKIILAILLAIFFLPAAAGAKSAVFVKFMGLTYHLQGGKGYESLYPAKLDSKGYFVMNFGVIGGYDYFFQDSLWSAKIMAGIYRDCAGLTAGMGHIGLRFKALDIDGHVLYAGIGPTILIRDSWKRFTQYNADIYSSASDYEYIVAPGIEVEYDWMIDKNNGFSLSTIPYIPISFNFFAGWKYYLD